MSCGIATKFVERGQREGLIPALLDRRDTGAENRHRAPDLATRTCPVKEEQG